jgi:hypothetical protein
VKLYLTRFDGFTPEELRGVERGNALKLFPRFSWSQHR